jgi:hypothetical protein
METLGKSIDTGGLQQKLSGEDQSECQVFKSFKHVSTNLRGGCKKLIRFGRKRYKDLRSSVRMLTHGGSAAGASGYGIGQRRFDFGKVFYRDFHLPPPVGILPGAAGEVLLLGFAGQVLLIDDREGAGGGQKEADGVAGESGGKQDRVEAGDFIFAGGVLEAISFLIDETGGAAGFDVAAGGEAG